MANISRYLWQQNQDTRLYVHDTSGDQFSGVDQIYQHLYNCNSSLTRDILIKCLTVTNLRVEARTELEGTLAIGVRMDATNIRLDYR